MSRPPGEGITRRRGDVFKYAVTQAAGEGLG